jgi:hypothetical protein
MKMEQDVPKRKHQIQTLGDHPKQRMQQRLPCATTSNFRKKKKEKKFFHFPTLKL